MAHQTEVAVAHGHGHGGHEEHGGSHHIVGLKTYAFVFAGLMVLLWLTVLAYTFDISKMTGWGSANIVVALVIAVMKMLLIVLFFMHVKYSSKLVKVFVVAGYLFVAILFTMTFTDYMTRHWLSWWVPGQVSEVIK